LKYSFTLYKQFWIFKRTCSMCVFFSSLSYTVNLAPAQSHIWHMVCKICFTIILCWLHVGRIWHTMCQKNGEAYLTHIKPNMLHMWLIVLHLRQLCQVVCHIWLCAGTDLQCKVCLQETALTCYWGQTRQKMAVR
jgi:hypothetical protein